MNESHPLDERVSRPIGIDSQSETQEELWHPPDASLCEEMVVPVALDETHRITMRLVRWNGQLVDWAVTWSMKDADGKFREKICIDCGHGFVHRHDGKHRRETAVVIRPIRTQADVQQSFQPSYDEVYDAYISFAEQQVEK
ncbi:hypothetical protein F1C15_15090 [Frigoribacterium sp. NBH87]|uniref:hypothetical protein n=1 Tax=Frigoribacterium sp. NBH87 TaxID=2596916 RepID=UPI001627B695|nr:hypothetical protein [Frigoribacterium sp. NBH87]QNE44964.1 hypothetical protein F1C15_15090 [Frigoribacterium sp. NBH87]